MSTPSTIRTLSLPDEKLRKNSDFDSIRLRIASPEEILNWSYGEVIKPETINYRTERPERDGLFCERIFGPTKDWQCSCGKYKKIRYRGIVCDRCGVEVTRSIVRRERMGHIKLTVPVTHIWFLRGVPSKIGLILDMSIQSLEKVAYFANFIITEVKEDLKKATLDEIEQEYKDKKKQIKNELTGEEFNKETDRLKALYDETRKEINGIHIKNLLTEPQYRDLSLKYGHLFEVGIGAEAISKLLQNVDLQKLIKDLEKEIKHTINLLKRQKLIKRLKYIKNFHNNKLKPENMVLTVIPVIPPDLRPLVQLDGGRFASSDLNDLYRRVINRNNRLKRLHELNAPEVILRNEKRMLQEAVDSLMDNDMRSGKTVVASTGQQRPLKSLADILKGKQGRFRQNLLGKRVDYSGRSVIVVGPKLKLYQCGLPKTMAIELFKPFIACELIKKGLVHNVRSANRLIEQGTEDVWAILETIIQTAYVLLNRAPTLHRLGVQAFQPVLIEGKAIQIHPLVCAAFNADFDGDQMAVHIPITEEARREAKEIILSSKNLLKPATGEPIIIPGLDMVWGAYWMTTLEKKEKQEMKFFSSQNEAELAYKLGKVGLQQIIKIRLADPLNNKETKIYETSVGRLIFNSILPAGLYKMDKKVDKKKLKQIIEDCLETYDEETTVTMLDKIKETTFSYLTTSGLSWGMDDLPTLEGKDKIIKDAEKKVDEIQDQFNMGLLTEEERYQKSVAVWLSAKDVIVDLCKKSLSYTNTVISMVDSGARGSWAQLAQMFGTKGIVSSPTGRLIELPIKSSFKEGFNVLEFFIATHGSRKGVSDTALRTASAGYLTRRMVDVCQDILINEEDCGDKEGFKITREDNKVMGETWDARLLGRTSLVEIKDPKTGKVVVKANEIITRDIAHKINEIDPEEFIIRSVLTCKSDKGICAKCYGYDLGFNKPVKLGVPVGIVAAQSIGEPGTQLTLRTFHTGGIAGKDITQGLPRVEELFEARPVKRKAVMARHNGNAEYIDENDQKIIKIKYRGAKEDVFVVHEDEAWDVKVKEGKTVDKNDVLAVFEKQKIVAKHKGEVKFDGNFIKVVYEADDAEEYDVAGYTVWIKNGAKVEVGQQLTDGSLDLLELYELRGKEAVAKYILKEIQYIYSSQGQKVNDKHVETLVRQMFSRCLVKESGDTNLLSGETISKGYLTRCNKEVKKDGGELAEAEELLLGITRVSLSTDSWLSAASFQETPRVLINAAVSGRKDELKGLKENVIIGRLIPAGTAWKK